MLLYHVSPIKVDYPFTPRIPDLRMEDEDRIQRRICVCDSIEGCFTAIPYGGSKLDILQEETKGFYYIYTFDTADVAKENLITPSELYQRHLVEDAEITGEYWLLEEMTPISETVIHLGSWEEESHDLHPYEVMQIIEERELDIDEAYEELGLEVDLIPCMTGIVDLSLTKERLEEGEWIEVYQIEGWEYVAEELADKAPGVFDLTEEYTIQANMDVSLEQLMDWVRELA